LAGAADFHFQARRDDKAARLRHGPRQFAKATGEAVMFKGLVLFALGWVLVLGGGYFAHKIESQDGVKVTDVRFKGASGTPMSALLYVPSTATAAKPAPGILAVHGYINSRETQDGFAIEFARRGYVVLAIDQTGHGFSGGTLASNGFGGPDGLAYLRSLPVVDKANIGLEGHSMGGWAILAAAKAMPDAYKAMVLEGSATGVRVSPKAPPFAPNGTPQFPHNVAVVYSRYDEFAPLMWGVQRAADVGKSGELKALFGAPSTVLAYKTYGDIAAGTGRQLYTPLTTHPGDHFSTEAIGDAVDWFGKTLVGGRYRPLEDQIWMAKEAGNGASLLGFMLLLLGTFAILIHLPLLSTLRQATNRVETSRGGRWMTVFLASILIPVLTFYPFMALGMLKLPASAHLPQGETNQLAVWALLNALIFLGLGALVGGSKPAFTVKWVASIVVAVLTVCVGYAALHVTGHLFHQDFRLWVVALKQLDKARAHAMLAYLPFFLLLFIIAQRAVNARLMVRKESGSAQYVTSLLAFCLGWVLFLGAQYGVLFSQGRLPIPAEALNVIIAIQFLPLMAMVAFVSTFTWRRTNSYLPGALINGLVVTWYITAGMAMG
jgi:pimeloyl-ACP methyl ester carboxylesterase